jgi:hypothetical protein
MYDRSFFIPILRNLLFWEDKKSIIHYYFFNKIFVSQNS